MFFIICKVWQIAEPVNKKQLASFVGLAISLSPAIPAARFKLLALYDSINSVEGWGK